MPQNTKTIKQSLVLLDETATFLPKKEILTNLRLLIDRVQFSPEIKTVLKSEDKEKIKQTLDFLFKNEITKEVFEFLLKLNEEGLVSLLIDNGEVFFEECTKYYQEFEEMIFISAVKLSSESKQRYSKELKQLSRKPLRIVYQVNPYLTAGFVLQSDENLYDYSIKTNMMPLLRSYLKQRLGKIKDKTNADTK